MGHVAHCNDGFSCDFCNFSCRRTESKNFFKHLANFHSNDPNFNVYCASCPQSFKKVNTLQKHFYRVHKDAWLPDGNGENDDFDGNNGHEDFRDQPPLDFPAAQVDSQKILKQHVAKFLLRSKEEGKLTQTALDIVTESTKLLLNEYLDIVKKAIISKMTNGNNNLPLHELTNEVEKLFEVDDVFGELNSHHKQRSYYLENFNLLVSIIKVLSSNDIHGILI